MQAPFLRAHAATTADCALHKSGAPSTKTQISARVAHTVPEGSTAAEEPPSCEPSRAATATSATTIYRCRGRRVGGA